MVGTVRKRVPGFVLGDLIEQLWCVKHCYSVLVVNLFINGFTRLEPGITSENASKYYSDYFDINLFTFIIKKMAMQIMFVEHKIKLTSYLKVIFRLDRVLVLS